MTVARPHARCSVLAGEEEEDHGPFDANAIREHEEVTKVKNVEKIELGRYELDTWYFSPMPPELRECKKLFVCDFSLHFFTTRKQVSNAGDRLVWLAGTSWVGGGKSKAKVQRCEPRTWIIKFFCRWLDKAMSMFGWIGQRTTFHTQGRGWVGKGHGEWQQVYCTAALPLSMRALEPLSMYLFA